MKMVLTNQNIVEAHEVTQINMAGQLTFTATIKSDVDEKIETTDIVFVKVKDDRYHPYKIVQSNMPTPNTIQYTCIEYAYYLFAKDGLVHDKRPTNLSVAETITQIIMGTKWKVGYTDPNLPTFTGNFYWQTRTDCFKELVEGTGAELEFYMTMANNKITSRTIEAYKQRGTDTHQRFTYGMNALEVIAEEDATNAVTKVYPRGSGEMYTSDGEGQRKITISDVEWSKLKGDPVDKPLGQDYLVYGSSKYDLDNGNQPSSIVEFQDEKDANKLIRKAFNWLKQNNRPKVQFKAKVSDVGDLKLGDRVVIDREDLGIKYVTRVFKLDRNLLNEKLNTIELGDVVAHTLADAISNVSSSLADTNKRVDSVTSTITDSNGNTVTYGPNEPTTKKKGDTWYKPGDIVDGVQQYDVYVWDGEKWVLTIGNQLQNELLSKVEQVQKDTEEAKQQAQQASDKADQIVIDFNKQIGGINHNIDSAKQDAQNAINQANVAISKADFNNQEITDLKQKQDETGDKISSIEQNYNGLKQTVTDNAAKQESDRAQLSGMIADKVSNGEFNSYKTQTADKMSAIITNTNNLFVNSSMELLPLEQSFAYITNPDKVAIIDNPFKDFPELKDVVVKDGFSYVNNKSPKILKIQRGGKVTTEWFKVVGGTKFFAEFDFYSNTGSGWQIAVVQEGEKGWWSSGGGAYTFSTFAQDKWSHWRYSFELAPQCTRVKLEFYPVGGTDESITYFDNLVCMKANIATSMIQQTQSSITELVQNQDALNKRVQTAEGTIETISKSSIGGSNMLPGTSPMPTLVSYPATQDSTMDADWQKFTTNISGKEVLPKNNAKYMLQLQANMDIVQSVMVQTDGQVNSAQFTFYDTAHHIVDAKIKLISDGNGVKTYQLWCNYKTNGNKFRCIDLKTINYTGSYIKFKHPMVEQGTVPTSWTPAPGDMATTEQLSQTIQTVDLIRNEVTDFETNTTGRLDVMSNNINLKVDKDKIINQINVSTEGILIDGKKTHITNQTTIDNAVITSAMIKDISANKITTGTLNAANVKIVNLDVNDLVGNKTQFVQSAWNSVSNSISINGDGIYSKRSDGSISAKYLSDGIQIWGNGKWLSSISYIEGDDTVFGAKNGTDLLIGYQGNSSPNSYYTSLKISGTDGSVDFKVPKVSFQGKQMQFGVMDWGTGAIPTFKSSSGKVNIGFGGETLWLGDAKGILTLNDIRNGKLDGLSYGGRNVRFSNVRYNNATYFAITSPSMKTGVMWGDSRLYFLLDGSVFPLADILRGATWDI